jgi:FkbM family methyltransferase
MAEELLLKLVRLYTYNTPISKGKYRLYETALKLCRNRPDSIEVGVKDGRRLSANLTTGMHDQVFFLGEFERAVTRIAASLIKPGDVCLDVGANFGWYTTLFGARIGDRGGVHSFEPVPATFRELERNIELMGSPANVYLNNMALGDKPGTVVLNLFEGLPTGHASLSSQGRADASAFDCPMITLDSYLEEKGIEKVDLVKVDIEGAEIMFLNGAGKLFEQAVPPVFLMEMALQQTRNFGYLPNDLIEFIGARGNYGFFAVDELNGKLRRIDGFAPDDIGANVFCVPRGTHEEVLSDFI